MRLLSHNCSTVSIVSFGVCVGMGRAPCCDKTKVKRGPWSPEEDTILKNYIQRFGTGGNWIALPDKAGLRRCGKSCRLRWLNYLRPDIKHGGFTDEEDNIILTLYNNIGSRWSVIASQLPGRTDNDVKNYWNTKLKKKLQLSAAKGTTSPQISKDESNNNMNSNTTPDNVMHYFNSTQLSSPFEAKVDNYYPYGNNSVFPNMSSARLQFPYYYDQLQNVVPQSDPLGQVSLPSLIEVSQFGPSDQNGTFGATSSSQEASSLSTFESSGGNGGGGGEDDEFLMGLVQSGFYFDLLNGFDFQEN